MAKTKKAVKKSAPKKVAPKKVAPKKVAPKKVEKAGKGKVMSKAMRKYHSVFAPVHL